MRTKTIFTLFALLISLHVAAQPFGKDYVKIETISSPNPGRVIVKSCMNLYYKDIDILYVNDFDKKKKNEQLKSGAEVKPGYTCTVVRAKPIDENEYIDIFVKTNPNQKVDLATVISEFRLYLDSIPFYSDKKIAKDTSFIQNDLRNLKNMTDDEVNEVYRRVTALNNKLNEQRRDGDSILINTFLMKYPQGVVDNIQECHDSLKTILYDRFDVRRSSLAILEKELENKRKASQLKDHSFDWKMIGVSAGGVLLLLLLLFWYRKVKKKQNNGLLSNANQQQGGNDNDSGITVLNTKSAILRKQSLDDVINNENYMKVDCSDFCNDSTIRTMYIKDTCIKDIYNMYAEDLRSPDSPKEDGCMVLGRWVQDENTKKYDVSLEYIVFPSDDAVFAEYELNFGGKIQVKKKELLRKLRKNTNLQYDLTCWVHSHPGLHVFFSNSDNTVHLQLNHPVEHKFLTAFVIDILTPEQELGIFTFKADGTVNSQQDLKKMYSLEEMYQWALKTGRNTIKEEDYFNTLSKAFLNADKCNGIHLSNSAIIDMDKMAAEHPIGTIGKVHGFFKQKGEKTDYIASVISLSDTEPDNELIGCFIISAHCSIPSIRKMIAPFIDKIHFVMVYATTDGVLTSIPIIWKDLCSNDNYYGEQTLEDLKIWTRRRR